MTAKTTKTNFAKSYADLQELVAWFERDDIDLEEAIKKFEEGNRLVKELKAQIATMENKIKDLNKLIE
jgi:exodeoxyribonuclease VII small subunit